ncbi:MULTISPECIES: anthranilate phosphoribosyltransferase [unclassified Novosphingobium]|uniref:anthranilate phosphoribosyltransferase n=1 Tax=unclassified Novosphingobium TaxID=2644732 RepID=UPI0025E06280|nr:MULTISPECIES: anthranilate phosphoribosyltransferase [unclassified Novosphingobium]HQV02662.1 anthranilate phosphoribosyltransferase [Novosphingobium sp.]
MTLEEAEALFGQILDGQVADEDIAATLIELAERGETAAEIAGAVRAMRARMKRVAAPEGAIDVCGTGGDGQHSVNVSTAVALVVAACGVPVAKHGNRAASSLAGGADTLEALGLNLARASDLAEQTLPDLGIAFLFAQAHHPALARVAPIRKALGRRTIFNLLGPLANPAGVTRQLVGVASPALIALYRDAMQLLDIDAAMIVSGAEGLDELSISGTSYFATIGLPPLPAEVRPEDAGLPSHDLEQLRGGDAMFNAEALRRMLMGEPGAYRDAVLLNAAAALLVAGQAEDWLEGVEEAAEALDKGLAKALLDCWIETVK